MVGLQGQAVMPISLIHILQRPAARTLMLAFLLLGSVHPALAYGTEHHHAVSQNAGQLVMADHHRSGHPASGHFCDGCLDCCAASQCSMVSVALSDSPSVLGWLTRRSAVYGSYAARDAAGPGAAPATPPPKLET
jgi:hypothetical protein